MKQEELNNIFLDVRNAFRLLNRYQSRVLSIVHYLKEQTSFRDIWGSRRDFFAPIRIGRNLEDDYANIKIVKGMWGWDFLYGYIFEYYFGCCKKDYMQVEMSIFQISDDGYFLSKNEEKHMTNVSSFAPVEKSHSYLVFNFSSHPENKQSIWLSDDKSNYKQEPSTWKDFLTSFLSSEEDSLVVTDGKGCANVLKKYEMQRFVSQESANEVIRDFAALVKKNANIEIFKSDFYVG